MILADTKMQYSDWNNYYLHTWMTADNISYGINISDKSKFWSAKHNCMTAFCDDITFHPYSDWPDLGQWIIECSYPIGIF